MSAIVKTLKIKVWNEQKHRNEMLLDAKSIFNKLKEHLEERNMLPDASFEFSYGSYVDAENYLPDFDNVSFIVDLPNDYGIAMDLLLDTENGTIRFAYGLSSGKDLDAYLKMNRIAAECVLYLQGNGQQYEQTNNELVLTHDESVTIGNLIRYEIMKTPHSKYTDYLHGLLNKIDTPDVINEAAEHRGEASYEPKM